MARLRIEGTSPQSSGARGIAALEDGLEPDQTVLPVPLCAIRGTAGYHCRVSREGGADRSPAQSGSAFGWGPKGRWFKSSRPD